MEQVSSVPLRLSPNLKPQFLSAELREELPGGGAGFGGQGFEAEAADLGDGRSDLGHVGGFAAFPAERDRGEERAVGLQHEVPTRHGGGGLADVHAVLESGDAGEAGQ